MHKITIVTVHKQSAEAFRSQVKGVFGEHVSIETYALEEGQINKKINTKLVIITQSILLSVIKPSLDESCNVIVANLSISKKGQEVLESVTSNTKAYLVNIDLTTTFETIKLIYQEGYKNIELIPYYPGVQADQKIRTAITPGEIALVPDSVDEVINIYHRVLSLSSLLEIATILGLEPMLYKNERKILDIRPNNQGVNKFYTISRKLKDQFDILFNSMSDGVIVIDTSGLITMMNPAAKDYIKKFSGRRNVHFTEIWSELPVDEVIRTGKLREDRVIHYNKVPYIVNLYPLLNSGSIDGVLCIVKNYLESEKRQHKVRAQFIDKGHVAKYTMAV